MSAEKFDYEALRWDFGAAGRRALARLEASGNPTIAKLARETRQRKVRIYPYGPAEGYSLRVQPADAALERLVRDHIRSNPWTCQLRCVALDLGAAGGKRRVAIVSGSGFSEAALPFDPSAPQVQAAPRSIPTLGPASTVEVRNVTRRQIFIDGKPLNQTLEDAPTALEGSPSRR